MTIDMPEPGWTLDDIDAVIAGIRDLPEPPPFAQLAESTAPLQISAPEPTVAAEIPAGLSRGRRAAVVGVFAVTLIVVGAAFALSFDAIKDMGKLAGIRKEIAWLMPVCIDGAMIVGTASWQWKLIAGRRWTALLYPAAVVLIGAAVSVWLNAAHAELHHLAALDQAAAMFVAALPAVFLAGSVHLVADLISDIAPRTEPQLLPQVSAPAIEPSVSPDVSPAPAIREPRPEPKPEPSVSRKPVSQGSSNSDAHKWIVSQLNRGRELSGQIVADKFGVSLATGKRWLADARKSIPAK